MSEITRYICGGKADHEYNDDWIAVETFEGSFYTGPSEDVHKEVKERGERIQMESVCCTCGSSAFGRDVYYGME